MMDGWICALLGFQAVTVVGVHDRTGLWEQITVRIIGGIKRLGLHVRP